MALLHTVSLASDRFAIDGYLTELLCADGGNGVVHEAMRYAVLGSAQRVRPILALRIARLFNAPEDLTIRAAAAVELLHCASLIIDDLPCMDDSPYRRERESVHVRFGEATAVLAAFGLVALAARMLVERIFQDSCRQRLLAFQISLLRSLDCSGLIAGQALDLKLESVPSPINCDFISEKKTVPLFNLAVEAGALFADPDKNEKALLNCFGREFGLAFQMSDDLIDGELADPDRFQDKLTTLRAAISPFGSTARNLEELVDYLHARVFSRRPH